MSKSKSTNDDDVDGVAKSGYESELSSPKDKVADPDFNINTDKKG